MSHLEGHDALAVSSTWKFRSPEGRTESYIQTCIENYPSVGLFVNKETQRTGAEELASFVMCYGLGLAGMLGTKSKYIGKGYAKNVMKFMCGEMKNRGLVPTCTVEFSNSKALKVMEVIGFTKSHTFDWIYKY